MMDWQPMDTAVKDTTNVLGCDGNRCFIMEWSFRYSSWLSVPAASGGLWANVYPTHWMPLPAPPSDKP